jgi:mannose/cellobiose epimerase-like protein (N-acyl-D-glucosamine 2-epimerase family)
VDWLAVLPERLNLCSLDIFNESEASRVAVRQQQQLSQQQQSLQELQSTQLDVSWPLPFFDPHHSTEENYRDDQGSLVGRYASIRKELDYSYHSVYSQTRQLFQDSILSAMLDRTQQLPCTDHVDEGVSVVSHSHRAEQASWVVFTAGVMG